jgi:hypothetical protein
MSDTLAILRTKGTVQYKDRGNWIDIADCKAFETGVNSNVKIQLDGDSACEVHRAASGQAGCPTAADGKTLCLTVANEGTDAFVQALIRARPKSRKDDNEVKNRGRRRLSRKLGDAKKIIYAQDRLRLTFSPVREP